MNDAPNTKQFREGFVENTDAAAPAPREHKPTLATPAPEIAAPPVETTPPEIWPIVVKLTFKPLPNPRGGTINELSFREPSGGDINRYGNPVRMNSLGDWVIEERKMHYVMAALCGFLPPVLDAMDPRDWNVCAYELMRFFLPTRRV